MKDEKHNLIRYMRQNGIPSNVIKMFSENEETLRKINNYLLEHKEMKNIHKILYLNGESNLTKKEIIEKIDSYSYGLEDEDLKLLHKIYIDNINNNYNNHVDPMENIISDNGNINNMPGGKENKKQGKPPIVDWEKRLADLLGKMKNNYIPTLIIEDKINAFKKFQEIGDKTTDSGQQVRDAENIVYRILAKDVDGKFKNQELLDILEYFNKGELNNKGSLSRLRDKLNFEAKKQKKDTSQKSIYIYLIERITERMAELEGKKEEGEKEEVKEEEKVEKSETKAVSSEDITPASENNDDLDELMKNIKDTWGKPKPVEKKLTLSKQNLNIKEPKETKLNIHNERGAPMQTKLKSFGIPTKLKSFPLR